MWFGFCQSSELLQLLMNLFCMCEHAHCEDYPYVFCKEGLHVASSVLYTKWKQQKQEKGTQAYCKLEALSYEVLVNVMENFDWWVILCSTAN